MQHVFLIQSVHLHSVVAERSSALDSSSVRMWVRIPAWPVAALVSLSKTLSHNCFVLRMGRKAVHVGPVCCVMHVKEARTLTVKEKGLAPVFLDLRLKHPSRVDMTVRYKSSVLLLLLCIFLFWFGFQLEIKTQFCSETILVLHLSIGLCNYTYPCTCTCVHVHVYMYMYMYSATGFELLNNQPSCTVFQLMYILWCSKGIKCASRHAVALPVASCHCVVLSPVVSCHCVVPSPVVPSPVVSCHRQSWRLFFNWFR